MCSTTSRPKEKIKYRMSPPTSFGANLPFHRMSLMSRESESKKLSIYQMRLTERFQSGQLSFCKSIEMGSQNLACLDHFGLSLHATFGPTILWFNFRYYHITWTAFCRWSNKKGSQSSLLLSKSNGVDATARDRGSEVDGTIQFLCCLILRNVNSLVSNKLFYGMCGNGQSWIRLGSGEEVHHSCLLRFWSPLSSMWTMLGRNTQSWLWWRLTSIVMLW